MLFNNFSVFFKLLVATDEEIRIYALKVLSAYMLQLHTRYVYIVSRICDLFTFTSFQ